MRAPVGLITILRAHRRPLYVLAYILHTFKPPTCTRIKLLPIRTSMLMEVACRPQVVRQSFATDSNLLPLSIPPRLILKWGRAALDVSMKGRRVEWGQGFTYRLGAYAMRGCVLREAPVFEPERRLCAGKTGVHRTCMFMTPTYTYSCMSLCERRKVMGRGERKRE